MDGTTRGQVVEAARRHRAHRDALGARRRDPPEHDRRAARSAPRGRFADSGREGSATQAATLSRPPTPEIAAPVSSWSGRSTRGRVLPRGHGQAAAARLEDQLGHSLSRRGRRRHRTTSSSASTSTRRATRRSTARCSLNMRHLARPRARHPAEHDRGDAGLPRAAAAAGAPRELPAAHAPARQGDGARGDPAERPAADDQLREQLPVQLDEQLRIHRRRARRCFPKGTIISGHAWHDNTAANKNNPDPNQWVGGGDRSIDEMAHAWVNVTYLSDDDYNKEVEARKAKMATTTDRQQQ